MTPISEDGKIFFPAPQEFARHALAKVGLGREVYGYFWHEVQMWCITVWPEEGGMRGWVNGVMMHGVEKLRAEGWRRLSGGARMVDGRLVGGRAGVEGVDGGNDRNGNLEVATVKKIPIVKG